MAGSQGIAQLGLKMNRYDGMQRILLALSGLSLAIVLLLYVAFCHTSEVVNRARTEGPQELVMQEIGDELSDSAADPSGLYRRRSVLLPSDLQPAASGEPGAGIPTLDACPHVDASPWESELRGLRTRLERSTGVAAVRSAHKLLYKAVFLDLLGQNRGENNIELAEGHSSPELPPPEGADDLKGMMSIAIGHTIVHFRRDEYPLYARLNDRLWRLSGEIEGECSSDLTEDERRDAIQFSDRVLRWLLAGGRPIEVKDKF